MFKKACILMIVFFLISSINLISQDYSKKDTTAVVKDKAPVVKSDSQDEKKKDDSWDDVLFEDPAEYWRSSITFDFQKPAIELDYGFNTPKYHKDVFSGKFAANNAVDFRIGYMETKNCSNSESVFKSKFHYFFIEDLSQDMGKKTSNSDEARVSAWRFGFSDNEGYSWKFSESSNLMLYTGTGVGWTKLQFDNKPELVSDKQSLDVFGDALRFGENFEGGIKLKLIEHVGLNAGFERVLVFPRHMFWYWAGSEIVQEIGNGIIGAFINNVMDSAPNFVPVVNFILRNAYYYGFYELRTKYMNWPIKTAAPFMMETFKVGLSFSF